ncbi:hypothetical protein DFA_06779 [Cavenderia fasciculata]|uniref:Uncharacterized protein n=1 Tax=Cavenderia fasciculata TaxID=261658 RepID=F4Q292_CACFS|nr:uncharacterized protein DFA_06779 [Cavenderia fasciculata]EGG18112.1 hypothetical protein DFA_06779 [Cavenderia fasciculata]|eukprot:XP_004366153.1 hypothetical protein DFA_06779 [Cavenderia fasciculata]
MGIIGLMIAQNNKDDDTEPIKPLITKGNNVNVNVNGSYDHFIEHCRDNGDNDDESKLIKIFDDKDGMNRINRIQNNNNADFQQPCKRMVTSIKRFRMVLDMYTNDGVLDRLTLGRVGQGQSATALVVGGNAVSSSLQLHYENIGDTYLSHCATLGAIASLPKNIQSRILHHCYTNQKTDRKGMLYETHQLFFRGTSYYQDQEDRLKKGIQELVKTQQSGEWISEREKSDIHDYYNQSCDNRSRTSYMYNVYGYTQDNRMGNAYTVTELYLIGTDQIELDKRVGQTVQEISIAFRNTPYHVVYTSYSFLFIPRYPYRPVELIFGAKSKYDSVERLLQTQMKVDSCCFVYDGSNVYTLARGIRSFMTATNIILSGRSQNHRVGVELENQRHYGFATQCIDDTTCSSIERVNWKSVPFFSAYPLDAIQPPPSQYDENNSFYIRYCAFQQLDYFWASEAQSTKHLQRLLVPFYSSFLSTTPHMGLTEFFNQHYYRQHLLVNLSTTINSQQHDDCKRSSLISIISSTYEKNQEKTVLITNASKRPGYQVACQLLDLGFKVMVMTRFPYLTTKQFYQHDNYQQWKKDNLQIIVCNVFDPTSVQQFVDHLQIESIQTIDILIDCTTFERLFIKHKLHRQQQSINYNSINNDNNNPYIELMKLDEFYFTETKDQLDIHICVPSSSSSSSPSLEYFQYIQTTTDSSQQLDDIFKEHSNEKYSHFYNNWSKSKTYLLQQKMDHSHSISILLELIKKNNNNNNNNKSYYIKFLSPYTPFIYQPEECNNNQIQTINISLQREYSPQDSRQGQQTITKPEIFHDDQDYIKRQPSTKQKSITTDTNLLVIAILENEIIKYISKDLNVYL